MAQKITLEFSDAQVLALQKAFPEHKDMKEVGLELAKIMVAEGIGLLAGEKRYLSLSHQYIEWVEQIYTQLLPDEEFTYDRLSNLFNFPPGTAGYMARVLRSRQNIILQDKSVKNLTAKLKAKYVNISKPGSQGPPQGRVDLRLTHREHSILVTTIDSILEKDETSTVQQPLVGSGGNSPMFIGIQLMNKDIPDILALIKDKYGVA